jgi:hypothetical protein
MAAATGRGITGGDMMGQWVGGPMWPTKTAPKATEAVQALGNVLDALARAAGEANRQISGIRLGEAFQTRPTGVTGWLGLGGFAANMGANLLARVMRSGTGVMGGQPPAALERGSLGAASAIAQASYRAMERYDAQTARAANEMRLSLKDLVEIARQQLAATGTTETYALP